MNKVFTGLSLLLFVNSSQAQRICGSAAYARDYTNKNTALKNGAVTQLFRPSTTQRDTISNEIINIPVVVHVLYNTAAQNISDAQVASQLTVLNDDFSDQNKDRINRLEVFKKLAANIGIHFCLAQVDPSGKRTNGIIRKQTYVLSFSADDDMKNSMRGGDNAWDSKRYLNIWVCSLGSRSLGYATPPGGPADKDGVVITYDAFGTIGNLRAPFNKGRTATHETGHWLGLKHLWGDADCGSDDIDDTPQQESYNFGCPSFPHVSSCSPNGNGDMFMNYMDFSDDGCMNMFTTGQKQKMRSVFAAGNPRNSFLTSFACDSTLAQTGPDPTPEPIAAAADQFKVYPTTVNSALTVEYKPAAEMQTKTIRIYSVVGAIVFTGEISKEKNVFDLSRLPVGVYIVKIGQGSGSFIAKLCKL